MESGVALFTQQPLVDLNDPEPGGMNTKIATMRHPPSFGGLSESAEKKSKKKRKREKKKKSQDSNKKKKRKEGKDKKSSKKSSSIKKRTLKNSNDRNSASATRKRRKVEADGTRHDLPLLNPIENDYGSLDGQDGGERTFPNTNQRKEVMYMWPESEIQYINTFITESAAARLVEGLHNCSREWATQRNLNNTVDYRTGDTNILWFGESQAGYTVGGKVRMHRPLLECPLLLDVKQKLEAELSCSFNSVMVSYYRDGSYYTDFGADDAENFGPSPGTAMLSLGGKRTIIFKPKQRHSLMFRVNVNMDNACALYTHGKIQSFYQYAVPPVEAAASTPIILLTFRYIYDKQNIPKVPNGVPTSLYTITKKNNNSNNTNNIPGTMLTSTKLRKERKLADISGNTDPFSQYVGKSFHSLRELSAKGIHSFTSGSSIDGSISAGALSILLWDDKMPLIDNEIYWPRRSMMHHPTDMQYNVELMMLRKNTECHTPVRVIRSWGLPQVKVMYRYDGLYDVRRNFRHDTHSGGNASNSNRDKEKSTAEYVLLRRSSYLDVEVEEEEKRLKEKGMKKKRELDEMKAAAIQQQMQQMQHPKVLPSITPAPRILPPLARAPMMPPSPLDLQQQLLFNAALTQSMSPEMLANLNALKQMTQKGGNTAFPPAGMVVNNTNNVPTMLPNTLHPATAQQILNAAQLQGRFPATLTVPATTGITPPLPNIAINASASPTSSAAVAPGSPVQGGVIAASSAPMNSPLQKLAHSTNVLAQALQAQINQAPAELKPEMQQKYEQFLRQQILLLARQHELSQQHKQTQQQQQQQQHQQALYNQLTQQQQQLLNRQTNKTYTPPIMHTQQPTPMRRTILPNNAAGRALGTGMVPVSNTGDVNPFVSLFPNQTYLQPHLYDLPTSLLMPFIKTLPQKNMEAVLAMEARRTQEANRLKHEAEMAKEKEVKDAERLKAEEEERIKAKERRRRLSDHMEANAPIFSRSSFMASQPPTPTPTPTPTPPPPPTTIIPPHAYTAKLPIPILPQPIPIHPRHQTSFIPLQAHNPFASSYASSVVGPPPPLVSAKPKRTPKPRRLYGLQNPIYTDDDEEDELWDDGGYNEQKPEKKKNKKELKKKRATKGVTAASLLRSSGESGPPVLFCLCRSPEEYGFMICCDKCNEWYHSGCIGLPEDIGRDLEVYVCPRCVEPQLEDEGDKRVELPVAKMDETKVKDEDWEAEAEWLELGERVSLEELAPDELGELIFLCYASYDDIKAEAEAALKLRQLHMQKKQEILIE